MFRLQASEFQAALRALLLALAITSQAQAQPGENASALSAVHRVGVAVPKQDQHPRFAATLGYGFTEAQTDDDLAHHRAMGAVAFALSPLRWLDLGLRLDARYDRHPAEEVSPDGWVLDSRLTSRLSTLLSTNIYGGVELAAWLPGSDSVSTSFSATTFDARLLAGSASNDGTWGALLGFRLDQSSAAISNPELLNNGDRLALGLSEYDAVLLGVAASYPLGATELLAEASADLLLGANAPPLAQSPLRVDVGARFRLTSALVFETLAEVALSARPGVEADLPLIPVEPRFTLLLGVRFGPTPSATPPQDKRPVTPAKPAKPPPPTSANLNVDVTDAAGNPVNDARVTLELDGQKIELLPVAPGRYGLTAAPTGRATLHIEGPGLKTTSRQLTLVPGAAVKLNVVSESAVLPGQVRGLVRSFGGVGLSANIEIQPLGVSAQTDAQGFFQVDAPPGSYIIVISTPGYATQRRNVVVEENGVVVINADLVKER